MLTSREPRTASFLGLTAHGFHRVVYYEWGERDNPDVVVCVHALGRNGRDFDVLGEALSTTHRVLVPDMPGRGASPAPACPRHSSSTAARRGSDPARVTRAREL